MVHLHGKRTAASVSCFSSHSPTSPRVDMPRWQAKEHGVLFWYQIPNVPKEPCHDYGSNYIRQLLVTLCTSNKPSVN